MCGKYSTGQIASQLVVNNMQIACDQNLIGCINNTIFVGVFWRHLNHRGFTT